MELSDEIHLEWTVFDKWVRFAEQEIIKRFDLKLSKGYPNYSGYYFIKKNSNRYFKKHLGFIVDSSIIKIVDHKKLMVFILKYGL